MTNDIIGPIVEDICDRFLTDFNVEVTTASKLFPKEWLRTELTAALQAVRKMGREEAVDYIESSYKWQGPNKPEILEKFEEIFAAARLGEGQDAHNE